MLVRVEATLLSGESPAASAYEYFHVTKRHRGQFNFLMWDYPNGTLGAYGMESLARLGVSLVLSGSAPPLHVQAYDAAWVPYTTHVDAHHDEKGVMKPCCWNDEPKISEHVQRIVSKRELDRQSGVFVYSLGDEIATRGSCLHPACLAAFRKYLQDEYGTVVALNASWGSSYAGFDQVALDPPDDDKANVAKQKGNYPRWYDRQAYQCYNFTRLCKRFVDGFAKLDPQSRVGFEGAGSVEEGDDYDLIVRTNGFWSPYPGLGDEIIRSIAPRDFPRSNWMGYTKDADTLLAKYWRMITRGCDSVWWWRWDGVARFHGFLAPHLGPYKATAEIVKDTQVVRDGLGTLLIHSEMVADGIAMVYSMPSSYASRVAGGPTYGSYATAHTAWSKTIRELGLQYRYVTDRMLRRGEFKGADFKVVIVPRMEAMGPEEAAALRKFVEDGGTLIADLRPGVFDRHCKPLAKGALDDLFGITRASAETEKPAPADAQIGEGAQAMMVANQFCDRAVGLALRHAQGGEHGRTAGGQAGGHCGKTPLVISKACGKGRAVLLNFSMTSFPSLKLQDTPRQADGLFGGLFAAAGVEAPIKVLDGDGQRERNLEIVRWRNGNSELFAIFREEGQPSQARIVLPREAHVYDLRARKHLGLTKAIEADIIPCRATFFAMSPNEAAPAGLSLEPAAVDRGGVAKANISGHEGKQIKAILLTAKTPDGKDADWLRRVVMVPPAGATVPLPVAYNDPDGKWTVQLTELYSNKTSVAELNVR
jgi:beta-galactosidase